MLQKTYADAEFQAFCSTCPSPADVTALLETLGFRLVFQMAAHHEREYLHIPALPAQFHYRYTHGAEVVYLAGNDTLMNEGGYSLPPHASRFWLYPGADVQTSQHMATTLALRWGFRWLNPPGQAIREEVA